MRACVFEQNQANAIPALLEEQGIDTVLLTGPASDLTRLGVYVRGFKSVWPSHLALKLIGEAASYLMDSLKAF